MVVILASARPKSEAGGGRRRMKWPENVPAASRAPGADVESETCAFGRK